MSERASQQEKARNFLKIHHGGRPLVLPNAWDVASAMIFVHEGFTAIGTTSAGIAASLGYTDGQKMSFEESLEVVERIARCTDVVGLNIEDRLSVRPGYRKSGSHCRGSFFDAGEFADLTQLKHRQ